MEEKGFCHTGASAEAVELCINKPLAKERLIQHHIPTPGFQVFLDPGQEFHLQFPVIVKPAVEDGSIGISLKSVVSTIDKLRHQVKMVLDTYDEPVLVEEFIVGRELAVAMLGNDPIETLPITEDDYSRIKDPLKRLLTYESKWDEKSRYYNLIPTQTPAILTSEEEILVQETAKNTFRAVGLRDFGRVDIRLKDGIPYVIDINEVPDLALDAGILELCQGCRVYLSPDGGQNRKKCTAKRRMAAMITTPKLTEGDQIHSITANAGVFSQEEVECVDELWQEYLAQGAEKSGYSWLVDRDEDGRLLGYSCYGPRALTSGTFDLFWIAVDVNHPSGRCWQAPAGRNRAGNP